MIPKVTISMPCWGRPLRTKRAIESILSQDLQGWEALIGGDGCPHFQKLIDDGWLEEKANEAKEKGNSLIFENHSHKGGCGYDITNINIQNAKGKYLVFMANDDIILSNHLSHYYSHIEKSEMDYMFFNSWLDPIGHTRNTVMAPSQIGHSEIIVKTELAKKAPPHPPTYGHDWDFIRFIMENGKGKKTDSTHSTYHVMHIPNFGTKDLID